MMPMGTTGTTPSEPGNVQKPKVPKKKPDTQKVVAGKISMVSTKVSEIMAWSAKVNDATTVFLASTYAWRTSISVIKSFIAIQM